MFMNWYLEVLKKYAVFDGRAHRQEYWMYFLISLIISIVLSVIDTAAGLTKAMGGVSPLSTLYGLAVFIPGLAVGARRLHDTGRSGLWLLIAFVPCIGAILLLIWFATEGESGSNDYGPSPK
jgi:uncharacterized membrane protein YhaH (DUF805 family)